MNFPYKLNIPLEYCVIEVIFGELLNLPAPRYIEVFYSSLLLELCKLKSDIIPQVRYLNEIYDRMSEVLIDLFP